MVPPLHSPALPQWGCTKSAVQARIRKLQGPSRKFAPPSPRSNPAHAEARVPCRTPHFKFLRLSLLPFGRSSGQASLQTPRRRPPPAAVPVPAWTGDRGRYAPSSRHGQRRRGDVRRRRLRPVLARRRGGRGGGGGGGGHGRRRRRARGGGDHGCHVVPGGPGLRVRRAQVVRPHPGGGAAGCRCGAGVVRRRPQLSTLSCVLSLLLSTRDFYLCVSARVEG